MKKIIFLMPLLFILVNTQAQSTDSVSQKLEEVVIQAKTPVVTQELDKIIYNIQADPQSRISNMLEMMRKVPHLSVDNDENILLNGSSSYKIFIDGKPSVLLTGNPKELLRSIPASTIKSIEVITNPPAKYDGEGIAGIINIITIKQTLNGHRGTANISQKGPAGGPAAGGTFTFKKNKLGISSLAGANRYKVPETGGEMRRNTNGIHPTFLQQLYSSKSSRQTIYAGLEAGYEHDSLNLVSGGLNGYDSRSKMQSSQTSISDGANLQQYNLDNETEKRSDGIDASVNYQRSSKKNKTQLFTVSYQYISNREYLENDIVFYNELNYVSPDYRQYNTTVFTEHTAQADYTLPLNSLIVESGLKGISRINKSSFEQNNLNNQYGIYETDTMRSHQLHYKQYILAAYNSYTYRYGSWQLKAGIRAEATLINGTYSQTTEGIHHGYMNLLPSIMAGKKINDKNSLSFSYTTRIQRPTIDELNPFINRSNPDIESAGNPYLKPIRSHVYQVRYLKNGDLTMSISAGGMFFRNVFSAITTYNATTNSSLTRQENHGRGRVIKTNIFIKYSPVINWDISLDADIRHVTVDGLSANNFRIQNSGLDMYVYSSVGYSNKNGWRANADITFRKGGILLPMGRTNGFIATSFALSKSVGNSGLSVSASVNNPFTKFRYIDKVVYGQDFVQTSSGQSYFRRYALSLNYRFGKLKTEIRKTKKEINNDDMERK